MAGLDGAVGLGAVDADAVVVDLEDEAAVLLADGDVDALGAHRDRGGGPRRSRGGGGEGAQLFGFLSAGVEQVMEVARKAGAPLPLPKRTG